MLKSGRERKAGGCPALGLSPRLSRRGPEVRRLRAHLPWQASLPAGRPAPPLIHYLPSAPQLFSLNRRQRGAGPAWAAPALLPAVSEFSASFKGGPGLGQCRAEGCPVPPTARLAGAGSAASRPALGSNWPQGGDPESLSQMWTSREQWQPSPTTPSASLPQSLDHPWSSAHVACSDQNPGEPSAGRQAQAAPHAERRESGF